MYHPASFFQEQLPRLGMSSCPHMALCPTMPPLLATLSLYKDERFDTGSARGSRQIKCHFLSTSVSSAFILTRLSIHFLGYHLL